MKVRKVPQRTCVGCRAVMDKRELVRIVRDPEGNIDLDLKGKKSGRGAYICPSVSCLEASLKGDRLSKALESSVPAEVVERMRAKIQDA